MRVPVKHVCTLLLTMAALSVGAADLSIERVFGDPALSGPVPRAVKVSPDGRRVALLRGRGVAQYQLDLWTYEVGDASLQLRVDSKNLAGGEQLSEAERARRERERTAAYHGIVDYQWAPDSRHVLFTLSGNLYLCDLDARGGSALRTLTRDHKPTLDPQVSPTGRYVSFVRDQDLWVVDLSNGAEQRLTHDGGGTVHNA